MVGLRRHKPMTRRKIYLVVLLTGLGVGLVLALLAAADPTYQLATLHVPVLAFVLLATAGLLWLGARTVPYTLGLLCVLASLLGFWAASPNGVLWTMYIARGSNLTQSSTQVFGYVFLFLFPVGWVLLADSINSWRAGLISYFGVGLGFVILHALLGKMTAALMPVYRLFWPHFTLTMLGLFGWTSS